MTAEPHVPVLLDEVVRIAAGAQRAVDATVGDGGHAAALLSAGMSVLGIDRDPEALARAAARLGSEASVLLGAFDADEVLDRVAAFRPDLALFDLGVSSHQLDDPAKGFSFRPGVRLDMRMQPVGPGAEEFLRDATADDLADTFRRYGDEPRGRRLAAEIVRRRAGRPFRTSDDLVNAIRAVLGPASGPPDFARLFQAIRIRVNHELERLARALPAYRDALVPGGLLLVISYHSGEDRIVKHAFREWAMTCVCPPRFPVCTCRGRPLGEVITRRPIVPSEAEQTQNARARSARLRVFRTAA